MKLQTTRHATMAPSQHLPQSTLPQTQPPHDYNCTTKTQQGRKPALSQASNMHTNHKLFLHSPKQPSQRRCSILQQTRARIDRSWCRRQPARVKQKAVSTKLAIPPPPIISPIKRKQLKASLVRSGCLPSTTPRRCWTRHRNESANHASRNNGPFPAPPVINPPSNAIPRYTIAPQKRKQAANPLSRKRQTCTQIKNSSYTAQSNHRNAAAQSRNKHGRVSIGRGAVANLRE
jgi:hypothetical protein